MEIKGRLKVRKPLAVMLRREERNEESKEKYLQISNEANNLSDE